MRSSAWTRGISGYDPPLRELRMARPEAEAGGELLQCPPALDLPAVLVQRNLLDMIARIWREVWDRKRRKFVLVPGSEKVVDVPVKGEALDDTAIPAYGERTIRPYAKQGPPIYVMHKRKKRKP
jgi:hypothetical protein